MRASKRRRIALAAFLSLFAEADAQLTKYTPTARWGHATTLIANSSSLVLHGGKIATGYSYSSAPNTADLLVLDLSSSFSTAAPPWTIESPSAGPEVSFHTLTPFGSNYVLFGGDATGVALPSANDSAWSLNLGTSLAASSAAVWTDEATGWANEPIRRVYHSAISGGSDESVLVYGGLKDDGSGIGFAELWLLSGPSTPAWQLVTGTGALPPALWGHTATWIDNQMLLIGGVSVAAGTSALSPLSSIYLFEASSTATSGTWSKMSVSGTAPVARRGHVAVALNATSILVHGGANIDGSEVYNDAAILTLSGSSATWSSAQLGSGGPSARFGHSAIMFNDQVVMAFGYGASGPADADLYVLDPSTATWVTSFTAMSSVTSSATSSTVAASTTLPTTTASGTNNVVPTITSATLASSPSSTTAAPESSASSGLFGQSGSTSVSSSSTSTTYVVAGSVGGAVALIAIGAGAYLYARRRSRRYPNGRRRANRHTRSGSDGFTTVEKAIPVSKPWRRFDLLEDEEAIWTGSTAFGRDDDLYDGAAFRSPSGRGLTDVRMVAPSRTDSEPSLFAELQQTPTRKMTRQSQKATPRTYRTAEMEEVEPALLSRSGAFSPSTLYGSTFSPVPATPDVYNPLKRSGTWWNRFATNAGILRQTPSHDEPIRDTRGIDDVFSTASGGRMTTLRPVHEQYDNEEDETDTLREENNQLLGLPQGLDREESNGSISSSVLEERVKTFDVSQRGPRPFDSASEDGGDVFTDAETTPETTPRGGAGAAVTPGSIVWRGEQMFSPIPPVPPLPGYAALMSPPSVYAPTPALDQSYRSETGNSGVKRMAARYEAERQAESAPSSPSPTKGPAFVRKPKLFVTNQ